VSRPTCWVCAACGKVGASRETIGDESCFLYGVEVYADTLKCHPDGRVYQASAVVRGVAFKHTVSV
jgi:hypothetical protein